MNLRAWDRRLGPLTGVLMQALSVEDMLLLAPRAMTPDQLQRVADGVERGRAEGRPEPYYYGAAAGALLTAAARAPDQRTKVRGSP